MKFFFYRIAIVRNGLNARSDRMQVYVENDFVTGEPTFVVIIPGEFVADRLSSISSGRASS